MKLFIFLTSVILIGSTAQASNTELCVKRVLTQINALEDRNPNQEVANSEIRAILIREDRNCQLAVVKLALEAGLAMERITMGPSDSDDDSKEPTQKEIIAKLNEIMTSTAQPSTAPSLPPPSAGVQ